MKNYSKNLDSIRKHTARILSILMILSLLSCGIILADTGEGSFYSYAASQTQGDFEYTVSDGAATLTAYTGKAAAPAIPASVGGYKVTAIGPECFRGNAKIEAIKVPEGITAIGDYAFEACSGATSLTLPSTLETIGKSAFSGDAQIRNIDIPKNVSRIDDGAFLYCMKAESITGGEGLTELGQFVFAGCENIFSMDLSKSGLTALPDRTFCNCTRLYEVQLPDSIETVGKRAFSNCDALGKLEFGPNVKTVGDYAFEKCSSLADVSFEGSTGLKLGEYEFNKTDGVVSIHMILPDNTVITDTTLSGAAMGGVFVSGAGILKTASGKDLLIENGQIYESGGTVLINALPEKYDSGSETWVAVTETGGSDSYTGYTVDPDVVRIAAGAFDGRKFDNVGLTAGIETLDDQAFYGAEIKAVSISGDNSMYAVVDGMLCETKEDAGDGTGKYRLLRFFRYKVDGSTLARTTIDSPDADEDDSGPGQKFVMPDNIVSIAPYAFSNAGVHVEIPDTSLLTELEDHSFTNSGIRPPDDTSGYDFYGIVTISDAVRDNISISGSAFDDYDTYYPAYDYEEDDSDPQTIDDLTGDDTSDLDFNDRFARIRDNGDADDEDEWPMPDGDDPSEADPVVTLTSESGSKSLYSDSKYSGFKVIPNTGFTDWAQKYIDYNKADIEFSQELMPYTMLYKGEAHYRSMVCVLNNDQYKTEYSIRNVGDDFARMYLAMDHGLEAEIQRGRVPDDIVLYSGITTERMADIAGIKDKTVTPTKAQLINAIGREFTDPAFMSTTTNPGIAASFSSHSNTMIVIYASADALSSLGSVVIDSFSGWGAGEYEILFNLGAKFKVLDVGTLKVSGGNYDPEERTYIRLQLVGPDEEQEDEKADAEPAETVKPAPVIHTEARAGKKMRVSWNKVSGAVSYKLQYRKAGASKWKTVKLKKTSRTLSKMKSGGLYQLRVAAVYSDKKTGKYSKISYRYYRKTTGIKYRAKKSAVRVTWKKTNGASGYKILVATNKNLRNAKVIIVKGGKKTSKVVKGLKSGKKYYFSVRPYKNKGGKTYNGIRNKIKRVKVR